MALSFVALLAGQYFGRNRGSAAPTPGQGAPIVGSRAPDISSMTPQQQRTALFNRVMRYSELGLDDSLAFFAPMAVAVFQSYGDLDLDGRYELGRVAEVTGDHELATAQADTILRAEPNHLLGLGLAARAAKMRKDAGAEREFYRRFIAAEPQERNKERPEYSHHAYDLDKVREDARRAVGR